MIKNDLESVQPDSNKLHGIYRGVIEDNSSDPLKSGRCKVRVVGVHTDEKEKSEMDGIPTDELPWAEPVLGLIEGSVSGYGGWSVPLQGSHVFVFFESGHPMKPRYFGSAPGYPTESPDGSKGFNDPDEDYPDKTDESDFSRLARNEKINDTIVQTKKDNLDSEEPDPYYSAEYPHNKVLETHSGITIELDDTPSNERIHVYHPSNSYIEINSNGDVIIRNANDKFEIVDGEKIQHILSNYTSKVDGDETKEVSGDSTIDTSGSTTNTSQSDTNLNGSTVNLNEDKGTTGKIVTTQHICAITGLPHPDGSSTCNANK